MREDGSSILGLVRELAGPAPEPGGPAGLLRNEAAPPTPRRWWFWAGLVLLCALPRILLAGQVSAYCKDAYFYVYVADQISAGNLAPLLSSLGINVYPLILIAGHWLGLTWTGAGVVWGVLVGSLTVLPLYGWLRRIGNDRLALAGCVLYIAQPNFIELSLEPIRDCTFWFWFVLCLYSIWRAMEAVQFRWCLATGIALTLAVHTRTEGWLLLIPLGWWMLMRAVEHPGERWRTISGGVAMIAVIPLFVLLVNLTLLRGEAEWHYGKLRHVMAGWDWVCAHIYEKEKEAPAAVSEQPAAAPAAPAMPTHTRQLSFARKSKDFVQQLHSTVEPFHYFLLLMALLGGRHWIREHRFFPLLLIGGLVCLAIWILLSQYGVSNGRYFLTGYLALLPLEAWAFLLFVNWLHEKQSRWAWPKLNFFELQWATSAVTIAILACWIDVFIYREHTRRDEMAVVEWLKSSSVSTTQVAVDPGAKRIGYHLHEQMPTVLGSPFELPLLQAANPPEMVIVSKACLPAEQRAPFHQLAASHHYRMLDLPEFAHSGHLWVLVHAPPEPNQQPVNTANTDQSVSAKR